MDDKVITMSNEYRSGWHIQMKKVNGKVASVWLSISDHNAELSTSMKSLNEVIQTMKLTADVGIEPKPQQQDKPVEKLNVRYFCVKCGYSFPAFPSSPKNMSYYCPTCNKWGNFEKR